MTKNASVSDDSSAFSSILLKREAATSAVLPEGTLPVSRPPSASSSGSFQMIPGERDILTSSKLGMTSDSKGESNSGGGFTGEKINDGLLSILVDSKVVSATRKPSSTTPRNVVYQLYFVTTDMIASKDICGGIIGSIKYDAFCGKSVESCSAKSHLEKKHTMLKGNTIFIIGKSTSLRSNASDKIINPNQYHLEIKREHINIARKLIMISNEKLYSSKSLDKAYSVFNQFCEDLYVLVENEESRGQQDSLELDEPRKVDAESGEFSTFRDE